MTLKQRTVGDGHGGGKRVGNENSSENCDIERGINVFSQRGWGANTY